MPIYQLPNGRWKIQNVEGTHKTREEAVKRLQAIKASQSRYRGEVTRSAVEIDKYVNDVSKFYGVPGANAGKKNGMYKHGRWAESNKPKKTRCYNCGGREKLVYHHVNHNELDNKKSNIRVLCKRCHERYHQRGHNFRGKKSPRASTKIAPNGRKSRR